MRAHLSFLMEVASEKCIRGLTALLVMGEEDKVPQFKT